MSYALLCIALSQNCTMSFINDSENCFCFEYQLSKNSWSWLPIIGSSATTSPLQAVACRSLWIARIAISSQSQYHAIQTEINAYEDSTRNVQCYFWKFEIWGNLKINLKYENKSKNAKLWPTHSRYPRHPRTHASHATHAIQQTHRQQTLI